MSFLKKAAGLIASPASALSFGAVGTGDTSKAMLSGIPFVGEGFAAQQQQDFAAGQSAKQMSFQERMSNTAHQRQTADLEKAGLNKLLSANTGASAPVGAMASGQMGTGAGSSAKLLQSLVNQERQKNMATTGNVKENTKVAKGVQHIQKKQMQVLSNTAKKIKADTDLANYAKEGAKVQADFNKEYGSKQIRANGILDIINKGATTGNNVKGLLSPLKGLFTPDKAPLKNKNYRKRESYGPQGEHKGTTYDYYN